MTTFYQSVILRSAYVTLKGQLKIIIWSIKCEYGCLWKAFHTGRILGRLLICKSHKEVDYSDSSTSSLTYAYQMWILVGINSLNTLPHDKINPFFKNATNIIVRIIWRFYFYNGKYTNFANISLHLNNTMRILTVFSATILPLSLITGIYGMNGLDLTRLSDIPKD